MTQPIRARVVETPRPKRPRLYVALSQWPNDDTETRWESQVRLYPKDAEDALRHCGFKTDYMGLFPSSDEELTRERIEAAIEAVGSLPNDSTRWAMRELVRRLGLLLESEGT